MNELQQEVAATTGGSQPPPQNIEAEKEILGAILTKGDTAFKKAVGLETEHFYVPAHARLFEVIADLFEDHPDPLSVPLIAAEFLKRFPNEPPALVGELVADSQMPQHIEEYTSYVAEAWKQREALRGITSLARDWSSLTAKERTDKIASIQDAALTRNTWEGKPISFFASREINPAESVLGNRWLERGAFGLMPGPTGNGKSSLIMQCACLWAIGRAAFGIYPAKPLRILIVQHENSDNDQTELIRDIAKALDLSDDDLTGIELNTKIVHEYRLTGAAFAARLDAELRADPRDLVIIDPLTCYVSGMDVYAPKENAEFKALVLDSLPKAHNCAFLVNCHTPKTNFRDTSNWKPHDWAYAGAGWAGYANGARAVIVLEPEEDGVFRLIGAKRGTRLEWHTESGDTQLEKFVGWGTNGIYWRELSSDEVADKGAKRMEEQMEADEKHVLEVMGTGEVDKTQFTDSGLCRVPSSFRPRGLGRDKARNAVARLTQRGAVEEIPGQNNKKTLRALNGTS